MMDDQTMLDLFDSLKREFEASLVPVKDSLERIEARMDRQGGIIQGWDTAGIAPHHMV
jgi:hypothetical protein